MELEATNAVVVDQTARLARAHPAFRRIDTGKRNEHIGILRGHFRHLLVRNAPVTHLGFTIDREDDRGHPALAVILRDLRNRRWRGRLEVLCHRFIEDDRARITRRASRDVGVRMDVDRDELLDVQARLVLGHVCYSTRRSQACIAAFTACGRSRVAMCPQSGMIESVLPRILAAMSLWREGGAQVSSRPHSTSAGHWMLTRTGIASGRASNPRI